MEETLYGLRKPSQDEYYNVEDSNYNMDIIDEELKKINNRLEHHNIKSYTSLSQLGLVDSDFSETDWVHNAELILSRMPPDSKLKVYFYESSWVKISTCLNNDIGVASANLFVFKSSNDSVPNKFEVEVNNGNSVICGFYDNGWRGWRKNAYQDEITNHNLLINSNFKVSELVNQRGQIMYDAAHGYKFDMWKLTGQNTNSNALDLTGEYVKLNVTTTTYCIFQQLIENYKEFEGRTVTFSVDIESDTDLKGSDFFLAIRTPDVLHNANKDLKANTRTRVSTTYTFNTTLPGLLFNITATKNCSLKLYNMKVEFGKEATQFIDDDKATKLMKCQRYLQYTQFLQTPSVADNTFQIFFFYNLVSKMRLDVCPALVLGNGLYIHDITNKTVQTLAVAGDTINVRTGSVLTNGVVGLDVYPDLVQNMPTLIDRCYYTINNSNSAGNLNSGGALILISAEL